MQTTATEFVSGHLCAADAAAFNSTASLSAYMLQLCRRGCLLRACDIVLRRTLAARALQAIMPHHDAASCPTSHHTRGESHLAQQRGLLARCRARGQLQRRRRAQLSLSLRQRLS